MANSTDQSRHYDRASARLSAAVTELERRLSAAKAELQALATIRRERDEAMRRLAELDHQRVQAEERADGLSRALATARADQAELGRQLGALRVAHAALKRDQAETGRQLDGSIARLEALVSEEP